jgi:predicted transcriptional regulator
MEVIMAKSKVQERGTTSVSVRLPDELLAQIDGLATAERRTRGNVMRLLLEDALKAKESK